MINGVRTKCVRVFAMEYTCVSPFWASSIARAVLLDLQGEVEEKEHYGVVSLAFKESNLIVYSSFEVQLTGDLLAMKDFIEHKMIYRLKTRGAF